jgi:DNA (cytosine-5)-methyltransferase 1
MPKKKYTYVDLFAGCGGLSDGFEQSQMYRGLAHVEWERIAADTLKLRLLTRWGVKDPESKVLRFDIQRTDELFNGWDEDLYGRSSGLNACLKNTSKIDLLVGGPPCQAYSLAGRIRDENGMADDYRNFLFESYIEVMTRLKPDVFVFENVMGILSAAPGGISIIDRIQRAFATAGFMTLKNFRDAVFHLNEFGVPQKRVRVIIIGIRQSAYRKQKDSYKLLNDFYTNFRKEFSVEKQTTARQALRGLTSFVPLQDSDLLNSKLSHGPTRSKFKNHVPRFHNDRDIETFKLLSEDLKSGQNKYQSIAALKQLYIDRTGKSSSVHKYHVLKPNEPSNTIPAHLYKDGLRHIHWDPKQSRSITVREAARLQGFDDDFEFLGSMGDQYKMIGNAVPPLFAKKLATALLPLLDCRD